MTDQELFKYAQNSALSITTLKRIRDILIEDLCRPELLKDLETISIGHNVDIIDLALQANSEHESAMRIAQIDLRENPEYILSGKLDSFNMN